MTDYEKMCQNVHLEFLNSLLFEPYDAGTRNDIYNFYDSYDLNVWLPRYLRSADNRLQYIIEFDDGLHMITISSTVDIRRICP